MKPNFLTNGYLRSEANEGSEGSGGADPVKPAVDGKKPGVISNALAQLKDKTALNAEIARLTGERDMAQATITTLNAELQTLRQENADFKADFATLESALTDTKEKVVAVDKAAAQKIVDLGFSPQKLPVGADKDEAQTLEELNALHAKETDPTKRWAIGEKIIALG